MRPLDDPLDLDGFAGGGGASEGYEQALAELGDPTPWIDIAVNHDEDALLMHRVNHPRTLHVREDVFEADMVRLVAGRRVRGLWLSPDCKHFSKAKGGKPVEKRIRGLAWVAIKWCRQIKPEIVYLENVEEFQDWGPLKRVDGEWHPDPERKGITFRRFIGCLRGQGYRVEWRELRGCDYGAPTIRKRLYVIARRDRLPIAWPEPTFGPGRAQPYRTAASHVIDWSLPCPSIFDRKRDGKPELKPATLRRIARGIQRYVIEAAEPFIVPMQHGNPPMSVLSPLGVVTTQGNKFNLVVPTLVGVGGRTAQGQKDTRGCEEPMHTVTGKGDTAFVAATLVQTGYGEREGQAPRVLDMGKPLGTVVGQGNKHALVTAFLAQHNAGFYEGAGRDPRKPMSTILQSGSHQSVVTSHLVKLRGTCNDGQPVDEPMPTVTASGRGGWHVGEVRAFLIKYYGTGGQWQSPADPLHTLPSKARMGLVTVHGEEYQIVDIGMRMLTPRELARAQGFPDSYVIDHGADGRKLTKTAQIRMIGNSVCPPVAKALVLAQLRVEQQAREAA